ncbi:hypothetical protein [Polyangium sp. y55x31]|uniref:hypothetical protein n=1 Tax=Polyangium sp. y55x31 TaxID=3042688 RepID=UPI0024822EAB|nr:hypothetical protein [Polyangium sp. y55x31]MDI1479409.1 hypothetical protein [Polyangium sp. y55x31]
MKRAAIAVCLMVVSCKPTGEGPAKEAPAARPLGELLQQQDLTYADLGKDFRWTRGQAFSKAGARDASGWPPPDPTKITVRYLNPDSWGSDPSARTGKGRRDCLVAICPTSKEIVESDLEVNGTHAVLELPAADCQIRLTTRDFHGYPAAHLHREPGLPGTQGYDAPKLPAGTSTGAVIDLGEVTPRRE